MKQSVRLMLVVPFALSLTFGSIACTQPSTRPEVEAQSLGEGTRIIVTTEFGRNEVLDVVVPVTPGLSAMDALKTVAAVDSSYGGGFVTGINGVGTGVSGKSAKVDWFYSINGFTARTGANGYTLHDGDTQHWDYRDWSFRRNVSATLGAFPAAFAHGYGGNLMDTVVVHARGFADEAELLAERLWTAGAHPVEAMPVDDVTDETIAANNVVLVAPHTSVLVQEVNENWDRLGLFARFEEARLHTYGPSGDETGRWGDSTGVLFAMQNPWAPGGTGACESVVVVVTGTDEEGVSNAAHVLVERHRDLASWAGALIHSDTVQPIP